MSEEKIIALVVKPKTRWNVMLAEDVRGFRKVILEDTAPKSHRTAKRWWTLFHNGKQWLANTDLRYFEIGHPVAAKQLAELLAAQFVDVEFIEAKK